MKINMGFGFTLFKLIVIPLVLVTSFVKFTINWDRSYTCLVGKTAIVTGGDTGVGFHIALDFAKRGARVILACKHMCRGRCGKSKIMQATGNTKVLLKALDFASLASVREFAKDINETEERLDILVNNAGAGAANFDTTPTEDGLNPSMQINYYGPFLLTLLLIDLLKKSAPSRIVNVSSAAAHFAKLDPNSLEAGVTVDEYAKTNNFANSKLCNILFTNELARRLYNNGVFANSLHPGIVKTELFRKAHGIKRLAIKALENTIFKTSEEGAQTPIYVAVSKDLEGITGQYFDNCRIAWFPPMPPCARDKYLAKMLWEKSMEIVQLSPSECRV